MARERPVIFGKHASEDVLDAHAWYQTRSARAARRFLEELDRATRVVGRLPESWPIVDAELELRRYLLRRFPFAFLFVIEGGSVIVEAVVDTRRRPGSWRR